MAPLPDQIFHAPNGTGNSAEGAFARGFSSESGAGMRVRKHFYNITSMIHETDLNERRDHRKSVCQIFAPTGASNRMLPNGRHGDFAGMSV